MLLHILSHILSHLYLNTHQNNIYIHLRVKYKSNFIFINLFIDLIKRMLNLINIKLLIVTITAISIAFAGKCPPEKVVYQCQCYQVNGS